MITRQELSIAAAGALRLARFDQTGADAFPSTVEAARRSFYVILVTFPAFLFLFFWEAMQTETGAPTSARDWLRGLLILAIQWTAFPVVMLALADIRGWTDSIHRFIAAYNWSRLVQVAVLVPAALFAGPDLQGNTAGVMVLLAVTLWILIYVGFIARAALQVDGRGAFGVVAIYIAVDLLIGWLSLAFRPEAAG